MKHRIKQKEIEAVIPRAKVAALMGVCNRTIKRLEKLGRLVPTHINSRLVVYPRSQVEKLLHPGGQ
jgi:hypothetical protein